MIDRETTTSRCSLCGDKLPARVPVAHPTMVGVGNPDAMCPACTHATSHPTPRVLAERSRMVDEMIAAK